MNIRIERRDLEQAVLTVSKAVNPKSPLPILGHVLLRAAGESVQIAATDLEMAITCSTPAQVREPGALTVPARVLSEIITQLDEGEVTLESSNHQLIIATQASEFRVNTLSADEYPVLPESEESPSLILPQSLFREMIRGVQFAVAQPDETREILKGILTQVDQGVATMTATDGRRLARVQKPFDASVSLSGFRAILPARAMAELQRLLRETDEHVEIMSLPGQVFMRLGSIQLVARILEDGRYPDCDAIIPKTSSRVVQVHRERLLMALRRAMIMAQEKDAPRLVRLDIRTDEMTIRANTPDLGEACERLPVLLEGEPIQIAFNGRFMLDAVSNLMGDEIRLRLNDPLSMGVIQSVSSDEYLYLVMPVRIKDTSFASY